MVAQELAISDKSHKNLSCNFTDMWVFTLPCLNVWHAASTALKSFSDTDV